MRPTKTFLTFAVATRFISCNVIAFLTIGVVVLSAGCGSGGEDAATNTGATNLGTRLPTVNTLSGDSTASPVKPKPPPSGNHGGTNPNLPEQPEQEEAILRGERLVTGGRFVTETANYKLIVAVSEPFAVVDADLIETNYQLRSTLSFER